MVDDLLLSTSSRTLQYLSIRTVRRFAALFFNLFYSRILWFGFLAKRLTLSMAQPLNQQDNL